MTVRAKIGRAWGDPVWSTIIATGLLYGFSWLLTQFTRAAHLWEADWTLARWQFLALFAGSFIAGTLLTAWRFRRGGASSTGEKPPPIVALDESCELRWEINSASPDLLAIDGSKVAADSLEGIVRGPFHTKQGCLALMHLVSYDSGYEMGFMFWCPACEGEVPNELGSARARELQTRVEAFREIQRLARNGVPMSGAVSLVLPDYRHYVDKRGERKE